MVEVLFDATQPYDQPLTPKRLWECQAALFPTGYSGLVPITVGHWRKGIEKPIQLVSGPYGREISHF